MKERFIPKEKTIIVSQKQNKFLIFVDILFSLFIDDIRLPNQGRSLILFRLLKDSTRKDDNKKKKEHIILSRFVRVRNSKGGTSGSFLLKGVLCSGRKNYNRWKTCPC